MTLTQAAAPGRRLQGGPTTITITQASLVFTFRTGQTADGEGGGPWAGRRRWRRAVPSHPRPSSAAASAACAARCCRAPASTVALHPALALPPGLQAAS